MCNSPYIVLRWSRTIHNTVIYQFNITNPPQEQLVTSAQLTPGSAKPHVYYSGKTYFELKKRKKIMS